MAPFTGFDGADADTETHGVHPPGVEVTSFHWPGIPGSRTQIYKISLTVLNQKDPWRIGGAG